MIKAEATKIFYQKRVKAFFVCCWHWSTYLDTTVFISFSTPYCSKAATLDGFTEQPSPGKMAAKCKKFEANIFNKNKCGVCFKSKHEHSEEALASSKVGTKSVWSCSPVENRDQKYVNKVSRLGGFGSGFTLLCHCVHLYSMCSVFTLCTYRSLNT